MNAAEKPSLETAAHERIYARIEREGAVPHDELRDRIPLDAESVAERTLELVRGGYLVDVNGVLELGLGAGDSEPVDIADGATIRAGRQRDLSALADTIRRVVADVHYPSADAFVSSLERERVLKRYNGTETRMVFVAAVGEEIVGWVHLGASATQRVRRTVELTLGVSADHRRRGIGTHLLQRGTEWGTANRFRTFRQRIAGSNDGALAFLDGHGWEKRTIRRDQYAHDGDRIDEVVMVSE
jgi:ribosomal protein S18 acetylase RimI-like enzyme